MGGHRAAIKNPKARRHEAFGCHIIRLGPTRSPYCRPWLANTAWSMLVGVQWVLASTDGLLAETA